MTDKKTEALKLALEGLEKWHFDKDPRGAADYIAAIKEALAQQPAQQQEPVAWRYNGKLHEFDPSDWATGPVTPLYTSPQAKPWVGLTDEEISKTFETKVWDARRSYARAIEAKLKEKNA